MSKLTNDGYEYYQKITEDGIVNEKHQVIKETKPEKHYVFSGKLFRFGKYVSDFRAETYAVSEKQARSNIAYQAKQKLRLQANAGGIKLDGKIIEVDD